MSTIGAALKESRQAHLLLDLDYGAYHQRYCAKDVSVPGTSVSSLVDAVSADGLAGYWAFDENTGSVAADQSGNGNDGTLNGSPSWVTGKSGYALDFDPTVPDYVNLGSGSSLRILGDRTFSAWIKLSAATFPDTSTNWHILNNESYLNYGFMWRIGGNGYPIIRTSQAGAYTQLYANTQITNNTWYHLAVVLESGISTMYLNGVADGTGAITDQVLSSIDLTIGRHGGQSFDGIIDETRIYNRALNPTEISNLYNYPSGTMTVTIPKARHYQGRLKSLSQIGPSFDLSGPRYSASQVGVELINDGRLQDLEPRIQWKDAIGTIRVWCDGLTWEDIENDGIIFKGRIKKGYHTLERYTLALDNYALSKLKTLPGKKYRLEDLSTMRTTPGNGNNAVPGKDIPILLGNWSQGVPLYCLITWTGAYNTYSPGLGRASSIGTVKDKDGTTQTPSATYDGNIWSSGFVGPGMSFTTDLKAYEPLSCAIEMDIDDNAGTITGMAGQLIENPADIIRYLIIHYSDLELNEVNLASLGSMRSLLSPAKYASIINQASSGKDVIDRLCSQAWCTMLTHNGKLSFVTFDKTLASKGPLNLDIHAIGRPMISWAQAGFVNKINVQYKLNPTTKAWEGNLTYDQTNSMECQESADKYGEQPALDLQLTDCQTETVARQMTQRFLDFRASPHDIIRVNVPYGIGWDFEEGDVTDLTLREGSDIDGNGWTDEPCILLERKFAQGYITQKWWRITSS